MPFLVLPFCIDRLCLETSANSELHHLLARCPSPTLTPSSDVILSLHYSLYPSYTSSLVLPLQGLQQRHLLCPLMTPIMPAIGIQYQLACCTMCLKTKPVSRGLAFFQVDTDLSLRMLQDDAWSSSSLTVVKFNDLNNEVDLQWSAWAGSWYDNTALEFSEDKQSIQCIGNVATTYCKTIIHRLI